MTITTELAQLRTGKPYVIIYRDNYDGERNVYPMIAIPDANGDWWPHEGGDRLMQYQGDEILKIWAIDELEAKDKQISELNGALNTASLRLADAEERYESRTPTQWAYDQACLAIEKHRTRADEAERRIAELEARTEQQPLLRCATNTVRLVSPALPGSTGATDLLPPAPTPTATPTPAPAPVAVKLPDELYAIAENIRTQDNRITDQPIFVVFEKREIIGSDEHSPSRIIWIRDGEEVSDVRSKRLEALHQECRATNGYERYAMQEIDVFVTACFTEQGCKDFLRLNGHNLRQPYIFAEGSYRNNEYRAVRNWLAGIKIAEGE